MANMEFTELLEKVQTHLSRRYAAALSDKEKYNQLKPYITTFLRENGYSVEGIISVFRNGRIFLLDTLSDKRRCGRNQH